jgi:hypothetical protein
VRELGEEERLETHHIQPGSTMNATTGNISKFIETCYILNVKIMVVIKYPSSSSVIPHIIALVFNVCLIFSTVFLNGITVAAIWKSRLLKERVSNFTVLIQSIVDLANGIFFMTMCSALLVADILGSPSCMTFFITRNVGLLIFFYSMTALAMMSFERYMGVLYPFVHRAKVTKEKLLKCFISVCSLQTVIFVTGFTLLKREKAARAFFATNALVFLAFTVFVYTRIFCFRIKNNTFLAGREVVDVASNGGAKVSKKARFLKELKIAKSCFIVVLSNLFCCLPPIIIIALLSPEPSFLLIIVKKWSSIISMLNSTMNSLVFFWRNKELRNEALKQMRNSLNRIFARPSEEQRGGKN